MRDTTTDRPDPGRRAFLAGTAALSAAAGLEGILVRSRLDKGLLILSVHLLQRSVAMSVDATSVAPA